MLGQTLARFVMIVGAIALPQSFVLDMGSIDGAAVDAPPAPLPNTTSHGFNWPTTLQTANTQTKPLVPMYTLVLNTSMTRAALNDTHSALPTTTVIVALPNPTPRPTSTSERNDSTGSLTDDEDAMLFNTTTSEPLLRWPHWSTAATFTLVFYDILTLVIFLWLWVFGYLWWFRRGTDTRRGARGRRGRVDEVEMSTMDMPAGSGEATYGRREREWVRNTRNWRMRSEREQRARSVREAELEAEMRRLGMI